MRPQNVWAKHFLKMRDFGDFNFFNKDCIILSEECDDYNNMSLDDCFTSPRAVGGGGGSSLTELSEDLVVQLDIDQKKKNVKLKITPPPPFFSKG